MFIRIALIGFVSFAFTTSARAGEWFTLGDTDFVARQLVTVENPAEIDNPSVSVHLKLADLGDAMPAATKDTVAVADESHTLVPFQVSGDELIFVVPVKSKEAKKFYVYASKETLHVPKFQPTTSTDSREAWRSFENEFMAFRVEVGQKAKTIGLAVDIFGKTKEGQGAQLKTIYSGDYHKRQPWGIDVMKVGHGPGLGGVYLSLSGNALGRTAAETTDFKVLYEGPVETQVQVSGPVELEGKKFVIYRVLDMRSGDRSLSDMVVVDGDPNDLKDLKIGIGLRDLPNQNITTNAEAGYAMVAGDGNQAGTDKLGLGFAFDPAKYVQPPMTIEDKSDGGIVYFFKPQVEGGSAKLHTRLAAYWNDDGWIKTPAEFEVALKNLATLQASKPKIELSKEAETKAK